MKSLVIYSSAYKGNTEKIATVFAKKINADLFDIKHANDINMDQYDLIGFGSGVYKESMAPQLLNYVESLNIEGKDVFAFSTSGMGSVIYNKKLIKLLKAKGANCKGSFACKGSFVSRDFSKVKIFELISKFAQGHPNDKDISNAEKFIKKVAY